MISSVIWLKEYWANPTTERREKMAANVSEEGFCDEFVAELPEHRPDRVSPDPVEAALGR